MEKQAVSMLIAVFYEFIYRFRFADGGAMFEKYVHIVYCVCVVPKFHAADLIHAV